MPLYLINYNNKSLNKVDLKAKFDNNKIFNVGFVKKNNVCLFLLQQNKIYFCVYHNFLLKYNKAAPINIIPVPIPPKIPVECPNDVDVKGMSYLKFSPPLLPNP